jgi:nitrate/TMAO reductase-like tetraheme cytochrome c subunit
MVMHKVRQLAIAALLILLIAFLVYTARLASGRQDGEGSERTTATVGGPLRKGTSNVGKNRETDFVSSGREPFTESLQCIECHEQIYDEWRRDEHATSWTGMAFKDFTNRYQRVECLSCHAPKPMLEVGIKKEPQVRTGSRVDGVDCFACHMKNGKSHGTLGSKAVCGGVLEPALKTSQACYHCHAAHNLFKEYLESSQYKQGKQCQDCHMKPILRPVAEGGPVRTTRSHVIHGGGHDAEALQSVLDLHLAVAKGELVVTVRNVGAAHGVPGEINNRIVRLEVSVLICKGKEKVEDLNAEGVEEVWADEVIFQAPPRLSRNLIPSTQIMPGKPRVLKWPLGVPHGKVLAALSYKLEKTMLNSEATPMVSKEIDF